MKKVFLLIIWASITATTCVPFHEPESTWAWSPVYISRESLENSVKYTPQARPMIQTGKIYYRAPYIYVNERFKGVHVINNTNPAHPVVEGFILAPGCIDMAVKENILYLDNAVDLVSFDLDTKQVTKRIRNVFPEPLPPEDFRFYGSPNRPKGYVLVEWKKTTT